MKSFCFLVIFFGVIAISMAALLPVGRRLFERKLVHDCRSTVPSATDEDVHALLAHELTATPGVKCLGACLQEKFGIIRDGKPSVDGAKELGALKFAGNEKALATFNEMVDECSSVADDDKCELAYKIFVCMRDGAAKRGIDLKKRIEA